MKKYIVFLLLISVSCKSRYHPPNKDSFLFHSEQTADDYAIQIKLPLSFNYTTAYSIIYVADGLIGTGQYVLGVDSTWAAAIPGNCIVVAIGHPGKWEMKRRRDFIPSDAGGYKSENFGNADKFYSFLKLELIPFINRKVPNQKTKVFIGHSFSGLFSLYAALRNEKLFDQYFAISPSVWANKKELLKIQKKFIGNNRDFDAGIHIYAGGLEQFNRVLPSTKDFLKHLQEKNYKSLELSFELIPWTNHYSVRKPAIDKILLALSKQ